MVNSHLTDFLPPPFCLFSAKYQDVCNKDVIWSPVHFDRKWNFPGEGKIQFTGKFFSGKLGRVGCEFILPVKSVFGVLDMNANTVLVICCLVQLVAEGNKAWFSSCVLRILLSVQETVRGLLWFLIEQTRSYFPSLWQKLVHVHGCVHVCMCVCAHAYMTGTWVCRCTVKTI